MIRQRVVIYDTETTGFDPCDGHRIIEIACMEMIDLEPTGRVFHSYFHPGFALSEQVVSIIGYGDERLKQAPMFAERADELLDFIGSSPLVCHGAGFDEQFLTDEMRRCGKAAPGAGRYIDTVRISRKLFPDKPASLERLYNRLFPWSVREEARGCVEFAELLALVYPVLVRYSLAAALHLSGWERFSNQPAVPFNNRPQ